MSQNLKWKYFWIYNTCNIWILLFSWGNIILMMSLRVQLWIEDDFEQIHQLSSRYCSKLLRGGPSEFQISRILTSKLHSSLILHPNDPILVLKWWYGPFLWKSNFEIWPPIFGLGESPVSRKIMISKNFLRKIYLLRHFSIFFDGTGLKMTGKRSARNCRSPNRRFLTF